MIGGNRFKFQKKRDHRRSQEDMKVMLQLPSTLLLDKDPLYGSLEGEINPNHPNLTIWHNKIDVCLFVGVHCHYSNLALKIIRGGTGCYTTALCNFAGDEEANLTIRDLTSEKILKIGEAIQKMKRDSRRF